MAKRYTDTNKFKDKWYRNLTPKQKCIWEYMLSACDIAGFFEIDYEDITFHVNANVTKDDMEVFKDKVQLLKKDLLFIPNFVLFQQKINSLNELNPKNNCHKGIIDILNKHKSRGYFECDFKSCENKNEVYSGLDRTTREALKEIGAIK